MAPIRISYLRRNISLSTSGANQQRQSFYSRAQLLSDIFGANTHILCHVLAILSLCCPVRTSLDVLFCSYLPVPTVLSQLFCPINFIPSSPVAAVLSLFSCCGRPVLSVLSHYPSLTVLVWLSWATLTWLSPVYSKLTD
jgi:hypothetical protein